MKAVDLVVVLGTEAQVPEVDGASVEVWELDEPSTRGIEGHERMLLMRDEINSQVKALAERLLL